MKIVEPILNRIKRDYVFKTILSASGSMVFTTVFALYNIYLGLRLSSAWHISICVFYIMLLAVRIIVLLTVYKHKKSDSKGREINNRKAYIVSCIFLLILDLSIIAPISFMVLMQKPVELSLTEAIVMAAYTTYKITVASVHMRRRTHIYKDNISVIILRTINFIDALISILTLQNTLIMVNRTSPQDGNMLVLTSISSAVIYIVIVVVSVLLLVKVIKRE